MMTQIEPNDPESPPEDSKRIPSWVRQPVLMYAVMVAAFAVCAIFVIHYVIAATRGVK